MPADSAAEVPQQESVAVPDQRTVTLVNAYIANTVKLLNQFAAASERKLHEADTRCSVVESAETRRICFSCSAICIDAS